jgi:ParB family chromosome partitioning protein
MEVDLHQLDLRYASLRVEQPALERRLLAELAEHGQRQPLVVVAKGETQFTVIDGYKRVRALTRLRRDTACILVWDILEAEALIIERLMRTGEIDSPIEQGWLLRELAEAHGLSQSALARRFGRNISWISRRLALVEGLPPQLTAAVQNGTINAYAAAKYLVPLARANPTDSENIVQAIAGQLLSTRDIERMVHGYQSATPEVRKRLLADPKLYLRAQAAAQSQETSQKSDLPAELVRDALLRAMSQVGRCQQMIAQNSSALAESQRQQACEMIAGVEQSVAVLVSVAEKDIGYARSKYTNSDPKAS